MEVKGVEPVLRAGNGDFAKDVWEGSRTGFFDTDWTIAGIDPFMLFDDLPPALMTPEALASGHISAGARGHILRSP